MRGESSWASAVASPSKPGATMHVLIAMEELVVVRKHQNLLVLDAFATIEVDPRPSLVTHLDDLRALEPLTDYELRKLYRNMTGVELPGYLRSMNLNMVLDALRRLPVTKVRESEVFAQAQGLSLDDEERYLFVPGARKPALREDEDLLVGLLTTPSEPGVQVPITSTPAAPPAPDRHAAPTTTQPRAPRAASGGKAGVIWEVTDKLWEVAGKPTDLKVVLAIRKQAMNVLEAEHGVKRATASSCLAGWQKDRLKL